MREGKLICGVLKPRIFKDDLQFLVGCIYHPLKRGNRVGAGASGTLVLKLGMFNEKFYVVFGP
jgi:hypothetical protein